MREAMTDEQCVYMVSILNLKGPLCRIYGDLLAEIKYNILIIFLLVNNHLKLRIIVFLTL